LNFKQGSEQERIAELAYFLCWYMAEKASLLLAVWQPAHQFNTLSTFSLWVGKLQVVLEHVFNSCRLCELYSCLLKSPGNCETKESSEQKRYKQPCRGREKEIKIDLM
jgi:hypothetical protein